MTHETDLPCSACGGDLIERRLAVEEVAFDGDADTTVVIAECPACGARFYPQETLARLSVGGARPRGDT